MSSRVSRDDVATLLERAEFVRDFGFTLEALAPGECSLRFPFERRFERPGRVVAGTVVLAAADLAMWFAVMTRIGDDADRSVTTDMKTTFLRGAREEDIITTARVTAEGAQLFFGVAESIGERSGLLAHHTLSYVRPAPRTADDA